MKHQSTTASPVPCTICKVPSRGMVYGAIACQACKVFFKRNSQRGLHVLQCHFDGHCQINIHTRHTCTYCRLAKCFAKGMQIELIRCSHSATKKIDGKRKASKNEVQTVSTVPPRQNDPARFPTLNLLSTDQSTLTVDQWNLLFNLSEIYDETTALSIGEQYISQQINLPHKLRFKCASMLQLFEMTSGETASFYKNNKDFLSLSSNDRLILLRHTLMPTARISSNFIFYKIQLIDQPAFHYAVQFITSQSEVSMVRCLFEQLDFDAIIMRLFLAILSFSTFRYTNYPSTLSNNLSNTRQILHIQDMYIELVWRYLLHKYGDQIAVKCFSDFLRCFFVVNAGLVDAYQMPEFAETIDSITKRTEQALPLNG